MIQLGLNIFIKFADENFVVCFSVVKELKERVYSYGHEFFPLIFVSILRSKISNDGITSPDRVPIHLKRMW